MQILGIVRTGNLFGLKLLPLHEEFEHLALHGVNILRHELEELAGQVVTRNWACEVRGEELWPNSLESTLTISRTPFLEIRIRFGEHSEEIGARSGQHTPADHVVQGRTKTTLRLLSSLAKRGPSIPELVFAHDDCLEVVQQGSCKRRCHSRDALRPGLCSRRVLVEFRSWYRLPHCFVIWTGAGKPREVLRVRSTEPPQAAGRLNDFTMTGVLVVELEHLRCL
mmetsp:Transcript_35254/g.101403  ORF Transcript_35254/g.101403 Transcript_35254/m.101403 type:complete len:224 (+) Transcript_35254:1883-2554(+)